MKKTIYTVALAALMMAGCSQDESLNVGEEVQVTFTANLSNGIHSRADGAAGVSVDKLICAVCKQNGETLVQELIRDTVPVTNGTATFTPTLLKGYKYGIVFWAYKEGQEYYDTSNLSQITFNPNANDNQNPNDEHLIVYTNTIKNVSTSSSDRVVTLTRPLAQVNVATTKSDWETVEALGETPATSTVILENCCNMYNALTGTYSGEADFTYTIDLAYDTLLEETDNILLGTGYTFPGNNVECIISVKNNASSPVEIYNKEIDNFPTTANYRTNFVPKTTDDEGNPVKGGLMTGSVSYEVNIQAGYSGNEANPVE